MQNVKLLILLFTIYCLLFTDSVFAARELEDYLFQYERYREIYKDFVTARDKYLKYKTLSSKGEVVEATKNLVNQRNEALRTYFLALKWKLKTTPGVVGSERRASLISQLDKEIIWLENQNDQIKSLPHPSLDDIFIISDRFEDKRDYFISLSYQSLTAVLLGKARDLRSDSIAITTLLTERVGEMESTKAAQLKDWLREVENKNYLAQKEIEVAESQQELLKKKKKERQLAAVYSQVQLNLEKSREYLSQAFSFQKEIYNFFNNE